MKFSRNYSDYFVIRRLPFKFTSCEKNYRAYPVIGRNILNAKDAYYYNLGQRPHHRVHIGE